MTEFYYIGLMSGTSLDGIDGVIVRFSNEGLPQLVASHFSSFPTPLAEELLSLNAPGSNELERLHLCANKLSRLYASSVESLLQEAGLDPTSIAAIGCHGQTIRHRPDLGFTSQIFNPSLLAELTHIPVVADFRSRDIAAGGQGAPLVPAFHNAIFSSDHAHRAIVNIGGISNITFLPVNSPVLGFDCGPGNLLMDGWVRRHLHLNYDRNGDWAASGSVNLGLLEAMHDHPFISMSPPKSTGRDDFHLDWLDSLPVDLIDPVDVQATLLEFTSRCIADSLNQHCSAADEVYICGGGSHNTHLIQRISALLTTRTVQTTEVLGMPPDWVEAVAFAWLARQTMLKLPGNLPSVTGASGPRVLGAIYAS